MAKKNVVKEKEKVVEHKPAVKKAFKLFPTKNAQENVFQYILRQFLLSDSFGRPSWTVTILVYTMALVGAVSYVQFKVALSAVSTIDATGTHITMLKGFSSEYMYLVIGLSIIITAFYQKRSKPEKEESEPETNAMVEMAKVGNPAINAVAQVASNLTAAGANIISKIIKK